MDFNSSMKQVKLNPLHCWLVIPQGLQKDGWIKIEIWKKPVALDLHVDDFYVIG